MSYTLQALIAKSGVLPEFLPFELVRIQLQNGFELVPVTSKIRDVYGIAFCPLTDEGDEDLPVRLHKLCELLSACGEVAYLEAEIIGGVGMQAYALFSRGNAIGSPVVAQSAINAALARLGVERGEALDEFESVGLDLHRDTDQWVPRV